LAVGVESAGIGADGAAAAGSTLADGFSAVSAPRLNAGIKSAANAAAATIFTLNFIVVSCAARRGFLTSQRRVN
jgi:hypothetical protein